VSDRISEVNLKIMRALILTEGGKGYGFGHVSRCLAIAQAFGVEGIETTFIVQGDLSLVNVLSSNSNTILEWTKNFSAIKQKVEQADFVIVDSYIAQLEVYKQISELNHFPVYLDDNNRLCYPSGNVLNGAIYAEDLNYSSRGNVQYWLGPSYAVMRKPFWNVDEKEIHPSVEKVLVTFGGNDSKNVTKKVLKLIVRDYSQWTKFIVIGMGFRHHQELEVLKDNNTHFIIAPDAEQMLTLMLDVDLAICSTGQTICELARVGVPVVGISVSQNQRYNAQCWSRTGFLEYVGHYDEDNVWERFNSHIEKVQSFQERIKRSRIGRQYVDGQGALNVARKLTVYK